MEPIPARTYDDLEIGERFRSAQLWMSEPDMRAFAEQYDPQPMHTDPEAAAETMFGGLIASGWLTGALTMKLLVESRMLGSTPLIGIEVDRVRFEAPVRPGDIVFAEAEVVGKRPSKKTTRGYVLFAIETLREDGTVLMTQQWTLLVPRE